MEIFYGGVWMKSWRVFKSPDVIESSEYLPYILNKCEIFGCLTAHRGIFFFFCYLPGLGERENTGGDSVLLKILSIKQQTDKFFE